MSKVKNFTEALKKAQMHDLARRNEIRFRGYSKLLDAYQDHSSTERRIFESQI